MIRRWRWIGCHGVEVLLVVLLVVICFSGWPRAAKAQTGQKGGGGIETRGFFRYYFRAYVKCTGNESGEIIHPWRRGDTIPPWCIASHLSHC